MDWSMIKRVSRNFKGARCRMLEARLWYHIQRSRRYSSLALGIGDSQISTMGQRPVIKDKGTMAGVQTLRCWVVGKDSVDQNSIEPCPK